jgi:hypothetical protein
MNELKFLLVKIVLKHWVIKRNQESTEKVTQHIIEKSIYMGFIMRPNRPYHTVAKNCIQVFEPGVFILTFRMINFVFNEVL